jgi:hypothetical protein
MTIKPIDRHILLIYNVFAIYALNDKYTIMILVL